MKTLILAAALVAAAGSAFAQSPPPGPNGGPPANITPDGMMTMLDANKDGVITKDEAGIMPANAFERADVNKDGKLSAAEFMADFTANPPGSEGAKP